ncbi:signal peptide-containing protein [Theileria equi strain WA]|uniref:Signal peptide-containing protein n=1 Tax=Theileria equi strain WA TaxID=1537102 RepID=L0AXM6_THEEQ|nr:signal peptide-containing protein [Theileria equi strain WA]AFZ80322.1 signal peptide-containing protein [Theileria equi strain WA]|eukprot:XP_004829988.1 signal peptide-containing protein [Theileria equi strain WA]
MLSKSLLSIATALWLSITSSVCSVVDTGRVPPKDLKRLSLEESPVHCLNNGEKGYLECPIGHSIVIQSAIWATETCASDRTIFPEGLHFDRTETLLHECDGFNSCLIHPVTHRGDGSKYYTFLGEPVPRTGYSLTIMASCVPREMNVAGRKQVDSVTSKLYDVNISCNEDELIYFSIARIDGLKDRTFCSVSRIPDVSHCQMKNKCTISKHAFHSTTSTCPFKLAMLTYYCRKPEPASFFDVVETTPSTKYALYAEQDASVTVSLPTLKLLHVESALWAPVSKTYDQSLRKDRRELLEFLCEKRNVCSFRSRRTSAGHTDHSLYDVHFGGITDSKYKFALQAEFSEVALSSLSGQQVHTETASMNKTITLSCTTGVVNVISAVYGKIGKTANPLANSGVKGFTSFVEKFCYNKSTCKWPADIYYNPKNAGYKQEEFELTVKYTCKKYGDIPSLVDAPLAGASFLEAGSVNGKNLQKETILPVVLNKKSILFINLELNAKAELFVGDFLKLSFPDVTGGNLEAKLVKQVDNPWVHTVAVNSTRFLLTVIFMDNRALNCVVDVLHDGKEDNFRHVINVKSGQDIFRMPISLMDVVTATGGITSMRVYYK